MERRRQGLRAEPRGTQGDAGTELAPPPVVSGQEEEGDRMASLFSVLEGPRSGPAAWTPARALSVTGGLEPFTRGAASRSHG